MTRLLSAFILAFSLLSGAEVGAAPGPYAEGADARADIQRALEAAHTAGQSVLVVFGANWCGDCKELDASFKREPVGPLLARSFQVVKVDVGRFDVNVDIAAQYHVPLKKGIPAIAVLAPEGAVRFATTGGELADARTMGDRAIYDLLARAARAGH